MSIIVALFGILMVGLGAFGLINPSRFISFVSSWRSPSRLYLAIGVRLVFGTVLILAAPSCRFPEVIRILGIVALAAAVVGVLLGTKRLAALIDWWAGRSPGFIRVWTVVAAVFGVFLVYAAA